MSISNINPNPRFTKHLIDLLVFSDNKIVIVDVGARRGFEEHWSVYKNQIKKIGYEPDVIECERLNKGLLESQSQYYPIALDRKKGKRKFSITKYPSSCGFYPPNMDIMQRFVESEQNLSVSKTIELETINLDLFINDNDIEHVDFIKLDTEGSELDIIKGAVEIINKTVLGIIVEVGFFDMHVEQPVFSEVDSYLRSIDFRLFDLDIYHIRKTSLPKLSSINVPGSFGPKGQIVTGDALYLRDGVNEINSSQLSQKNWNEIRILKLASLMELYNLPDCAIELLQFSHNAGLLKNYDLSYLTDLLVPKTNGKIISYSEYMEKVHSKSETESINRIRRKKQLTKNILPKYIRTMIRKSLVKLRDKLNKIIHS